MMPLCSLWSSENSQWRNANWKWSECSSSIPPIPVVTVGNQPGVDATTLIPEWLEGPWNPYTANDEHDKKRKRLIKLICKVKNKPFEESKYVTKNATISINDIKMVVKAVSGVELKINENIWNIQNNQ